MRRDPHHTSPDGDEGYPGALIVAVTYALTDRNELVVDYRAATDRPTPVNLTQHSYFNLAGRGRGDILGHRLALRASRFTPVDATLIPTGELRAVHGTPFDFTTPRPIGAALAAGAHDEQLRLAHGFDHNFVLDRDGRGTAPSPAAVLHEPVSGRTLEILTTEPGIQLYTGNVLGGRFTPHAGLALETQHFPDSPNHPDFPSTILRPGEEYRSRSVYRFTVTDESP